MKPRITFEINVTRDVETFFCFVRDAKYDKGDAIEWALLKKYPNLKTFFRGTKFIKTRKEVRAFVEKEYEKNAVEMKKNLKCYERNWNKHEKKYFQLVSKIFPKTIWPKGKYIAYTTIWGMYPRFLKDSTFQIPWKYKPMTYVNIVIAHELLHFIWYKFYKERFLKKITESSNDFFVWNVSEIFNCVVQGSDKWMKEFGETCQPYPNQMEIIKNLNKKYHKKTIDAVLLTQDIIDTVRDNKLAT